MMEAAREYPDVHFIAATGDTAWKEGIDNVSNMFPHTYESRYVSRCRCRYETEGIDGCRYRY